MATIHCTGYSAVLRDIVRAQKQRGPLPPSFLLPAFSHSQKSTFTTSAAAQARRKDGNFRRGMSALKSSGLGKNYKLHTDIWKYPLPQPVCKRIGHHTNRNHGLWGFFDQDHSALMTPEALSQHGRAWTVAELRKKDFDDLWRLYWKCIKEVNRINTYERERTRLKIHFGEHEAKLRMEEAQKTQKAIKHALTERWYQFESARELAMSDPEINLYADPEKGEPGYLRGEEDAFESIEDRQERP